MNSNLLLADRFTSTFGDQRGSDRSDVIPAPVMTDAQKKTIAGLRATYRFESEPSMREDGTVTLAYAASNNAQQHVTVRALIQPAGKYTTSHLPPAPVSEPTPMSVAQTARVKALRATVRLEQEPALQSDGTVTLTYAASDNAGFPVSVHIVIALDGTYSRARVGR